MKTCTFIIWISLLVLFPQGLYSKSLTKREQYNSDSDNSNSDERRNEAEADVRDEAAIRDNLKPKHKHKHKHKDTGYLLRFDRSDAEVKKDDAKALQCAVMYKDNEPVGILQPFKESYRFLPVNGDATLVDINPVPVKRKTIMDVIYPKNDNEDYKEEDSEINSQFTDDRYPSIFAKFKIDSRLDRSLNPDLNMKRSMNKRDTDKPDMTDEQVSSLKTTLSKMKNDNSAVVEEKLKNILDDMGLIDDYDEKEESKREVSEDENLEQGTNKINLIKEEHNDTRDKRGEEGQGEIPSSAPIEATTAIDPSESSIKEEHTEEMESIDLFKDDAKIKDSENVNLDVSTESEEARKRRQNEESEVKKQGIKEEKQGIKEEKREITDTVPDFNSAQLVKESELNQYEKRVEREIREKIQKLKEEVKQEIMGLRDSSAKTTSNESDTKRRKRQAVNTLIDEETQDIDPNLSGEEGLKEHHVRRKRGLLNPLVTGGDKIAKNKIELLHINKESEKITNNTKNPQIINKTYADIDLSPKGKQKIDGQSDELRFVINLGDKSIGSTDVNNVRKTKNSTHTTADVEHFYNYHSLNNKNFQPNTSNYETVKNNTGDRVQSLKSNKTYFQNDKIQNATKIMKNTHEREHNLNKLKINRNNNNKFYCNETSCSTCLEKRERPTISGFQKTKTRSNLGRTIYRPSTLKPKYLPSEIKKRKDIINILNVIEKKNKHNANETAACNDKFGCTKCRKSLVANAKIKENSEEINVNTSHVNKMPKSETKLSPKTKTNITNHACLMKDSKVTNKTDRIHSNVTSNVSDHKVVNTVETPRFIGINPILQNATNSTRYLNRKLKQADDDTDNENLGLYDEKVVQDIDDIAKIKRPGENAGENLEKFNGDPDETNPDTGIHIRLKRFGAKENRGNYNGRTHPRRKRQARDDLEENVYQYNDSEFNEDPGVENNSYYDEPYADDNVASINNNCNCDKTDSACKCGTQQKSGPSVPNIKEEYAEYDDGPSSNIEKKSVHHCHCDKNGKHCKCKTSSDASQYADYAEDQMADAEKQSQDLYDAGAMGDLQAEQERAPRRPRQKSRPAQESVGNTEDEAEEYGGDYETGSNKVAKREARFRQLAGNQPFQNGEYFVDLHPNIYRLTPVDNSREKRESFKDLVAIHGGGPAMNHLAAVKQRSMLPHSRFRRRVQVVDDNREPRQLIDMSDQDIFGALPQGFAGELARYKRVKRGKIEK